jgi:RNA polymerase sigma-70 factor (ECF subfamily)
MTDARPRKDDFALLDAWGTGDTSAARELLQRYTGPLVAFFDRKLDGPVEDLVQDTLVACIEGRHRFRREAGFRSYVFGVARNILLAAIRSRYSTAAALDLETSCLADLAPSPSEIMAGKRERRVLLDALRRLPVETQILLELYHFQRLSGPEVAALLGLGERALRSRLHRALEQLRGAVEEAAASDDLARSSWADFEAWAQALPEA